MSLGGCDCPLPALAACHRRGMVCRGYLCSVLCSMRGPGGVLGQGWLFAWQISHSLVCQPKLFHSDSARGIQARSLRCSPHRASLPSPQLLMADAGVCAASPLGELPQGLQSAGFNCLFIFPPCYVALCASKARHRFSSENVSWCLETSLFLRLPSWDGTPSLPLLSLFLSFIFFPTSFQRRGLFFWMPDVLCRHSEVVLWNLLGV